MRNDRNNMIVKLSSEFAPDMPEFPELPGEKKKYIIAL